MAVQARPVPNKSAVANGGGLVTRASSAPIVLPMVAWGLLFQCPGRPGVIPCPSPTTTEVVTTGPKKSYPV